MLKIFQQILFMKSEPLASLKSASEILHDTNDFEQRIKLINILSHDVQELKD